MATISDIGGGNNDFPDLISWGNARGSSPDLEIAHVYSDQTLASDFDHRTDFTGGYEVVGMGNDFVGDFTDTGVIRITRDPAYTSWLIDDRTGRGHWKNLIIDCVDGNVLFRGGVTRFEATNVGFKGNSAPSFDEASVNFNGIFNQCAFFTTIGDAASFRYGQVTFNDCIAVGNTNTLFGTVRIRDMTGTVTNTVAHERQGSLCFGADGSTVTGSGCVSTDNSASTLSIGSQDTSLPTYFENVSTGDLRINSAGQAALPASLSWAFVSVGGNVLVPSAIPGEEAFGSLSVTVQSTNISPTSVPSYEIVEGPSIIPLGIVISPEGLLSFEQVSSPVVQVGLYVVGPDGIDSVEFVPDPTLDLLLKKLLIPNVPDTFSVGRPTVLGGDRIVIPVVSRTNFTQIKEYLTTLGFSGALEDVILAWLRSEGYEGQWNDAWYAYLGSIGHVGALPERLYRWRRGLLEAPWILDGGIWNDAGIWQDGATWSDS